MQWNRFASLVLVIAQGATLMGAAAAAAAAQTIMPPPTTAPVVDTLTAAEFKAAAKLFDYREDRVTGLGWYTVPDGYVMKARRKRIEPAVSSTGQLLLRSIYRDADWLFHDQVVVRIGSQLYATTPLSSATGGVNREVRDRYVDELLSFPTAALGPAIVEAIATADSVAPVIVRLMSQRTNKAHTYDMGDEERSRFVAAWRLAQTLRARNP
jgi:hypothetical protein